MPQLTFQQANPARDSTQELGGELLRCKSAEWVSDDFIPAKTLDTFSQHVGGQSPRVVAAYKVEIGKKLATACMMLRFLHDRDGARKLRDVAYEIVGEDEFERCLLEIDTEELGRVLGRLHARDGEGIV